MWLAQDEVNGYNLWVNSPQAGRIVGPEPAGAVEETPDGPAAVFRHEITWQAPDGTPLLREQRVTAITPAPAAGVAQLYARYLAACRRGLGEALAWRA